MEINKEHQHYIYNRKTRQYVKTFEYMADAIQYLFSDGNSINCEIHIVFDDAVRFILTSKFCIPGKPLIMGKHPSKLKNAIMNIGFYSLSCAIAIEIGEQSNNAVLVLLWCLLYIYIADKLLPYSGSLYVRLAYMLLSTILVAVYFITIKPHLPHF